jgi:TetR/AcrR family transcriptional regulator
MARPVAADHADKRLKILTQSAILFAEHGYDRASITMITRACGVSKALLYHYYADKEALLFDIIDSHLRHLLAVTAAALGEVTNVRQRLVALSTALLVAYRDASAQHQVQIGQLRLLPPAQQQRVKMLERQLVDRFAAEVARAVPADPAHLKPLTMSLFGMLNWNFLWFREDGPLSREEYAEYVVEILLDGAGRTARGGCRADRQFASSAIARERGG